MKKLLLIAFLVLTSFNAHAQPSIPLTTVYPEWYGAVPNDPSFAAQNVTAINTAIASLTDGGVVEFVGTNYFVNAPVVCNTSFVTLKGNVKMDRGVGFAHIISTSSSATILKCGDTVSQHESINLEDIQILRQGGMGIAGSKSIDYENVLFANCYHCGWQDSQYGLYIGGIFSGTGMSVWNGRTAVTGVISGNPIYLAYNDSSNVAGKSSFYIDGLGIGGNPSVNTTTNLAYGVYLNSAGSGLGDNQIKNVIVSGKISYVVYGQDNGGFSADVILKNFSADAIQIAGIALVGTSPSTNQNMVIDNAWFNLDNPVGTTAYGVQLVSEAHTSVNNLKCSMGLRANVCLSLLGSPYTSFNNLTHLQGGSGSTVFLAGSDSHANRSDYITGQIVGDSTGGISLASSSGSTIIVASPVSPFSIASGSNNNTVFGSFASMSDSGTGNNINGTSGLSLPLSVVNGGTGTATPSLVAGANVAISGVWPNQTISASGGGGGSRVCSWGSNSHYCQDSGTGEIDQDGVVVTSNSGYVTWTFPLACPTAPGIVTCSYQSSNNFSGGVNVFQAAATTTGIPIAFTTPSNIYAADAVNCHMVCH